MEVWYDGVLVGEYFADVFVEKCVIVEVKALVETVVGVVEDDPIDVVVTVDTCKSKIIFKYKN